jgi:F-type H+-transporting ATPase subunit a
LFGNLFAGAILLLVMAFLIPVGVPIVFYLLELLIGAIQALVFAMLTMVFVAVAQAGHGDHGEHEEHGEGH